MKKKPAIVFSECTFMKHFVVKCTPGMKPYDLQIYFENGSVYIEKLKNVLANK